MEYFVPKNLRLTNQNRESVKLERLFLDNGLSRNAFIEAYREGRVQMNGAPVGRNTKIPPYKTVELSLEEESSFLVPEAIALRILSEDAHLLVVDKPDNLPMMPPEGEESGSLANRVQYDFDQKGLRRKIRFVNRLDMQTSGIVLIAKHKYMQANLQTQMEEGAIEKRYIAIVQGQFAESERAGSIRVPLGRDPNSPRRIPDEAGQDAHTEYQVIHATPENSLVLIRLHTGRTHQIRAHFAAIGHPVCGDTLYGASESTRVFLHSFSYRFRTWEGRERIIRCMPRGNWSNAVNLTEEQITRLLQGLPE